MYGCPVVDPSSSYRLLDTGSGAIDTESGRVATQPERLAIEFIEIY
jgi:hypothetical protein